ncbi:hypothetical protein [Pseudomonas sp.]|uniref:hypothetical protein n=1 Tax=Pseudomonas sp. TaxID=306 RepID=UPI00261DAF14|nr:hypothetical protein [Pseudomonas sp.]
MINYPDYKNFTYVGGENGFRPKLGWGEVPEKLTDKENKISLTVYDQQHQQYTGRKVSLCCNDDPSGPKWVLTIQLPNGEQKSFNSSESSAIIRIFKSTTDLSLITSK